jgi:hypothetical protein
MTRWKRSVECVSNPRPASAGLFLKYLLAKCYFTVAARRASIMENWARVCRRSRGFVWAPNVLFRNIAQAPRIGNTG